MNDFKAGDEAWELSYPSERDSICNISGVGVSLFGVVGEHNAAFINSLTREGESFFKSKSDAIDALIRHLESLR